MNILVFRVGQLGDMLTALPAFWAVREHFKDARLTLLSDVQHGRKFVLAKDLFAGAGLFDDFMTYTYHRSRLRKALSTAALLLDLRRRNFNKLVYLYPPERSVNDVERDRRFFRMAGITSMLGMDAECPLPVRSPNQPLPNSQLEVDMNLARLKSSGIPLPAPGMGRMDLNLGVPETRELEAWLALQISDGGRRWIGIGPGSKMPAKVWAEKNFEQCVASLIQRYDFWPVIFGGPEDRLVGARLIAAWKRGYCAAGDLSLRASALGLSRCKLYLGNDTGTMHLAASVKTSCTAIFSARDFPGRWNPYGVPYRVLRKQIDCEGCLLTECIERRNECLRAIGVDEVLAACEALLGGADAP